jgi:hypothetical protein
MELCVNVFFIQGFFSDIVSGSGNLEHLNSRSMNCMAAVYNVEFVLRKINKNLETRMNKLKGQKTFPLKFRDSVQ